MTLLKNVVLDMECLLYDWILGGVSHVDGSTRHETRCNEDKIDSLVDFDYFCSHFFVCFILKFVVSLTNLKLA